MNKDLNLTTMSLEELVALQLAMDAEQRRRRIATVLRKIGEARQEGTHVPERADDLQSRILREVRTTRRYVIIDDCLEQLEIILDL